MWCTSHTNSHGEFLIEACTHTHTHTHKHSENKGKDTWDSPVVWVVTCTSASSSWLPHVEALYLPTASLSLSLFYSVCVCVCACVNHFTWGNQSCEKKMVLDENSDLTCSQPLPPREVLRFKKGIGCWSDAPHFLGGDCHVGQLSRKAMRVQTPQPPMCPQ